jgi:tetrahydromethanopterin S-methyltransferase subunit A
MHDLKKRLEYFAGQVCKLLFPIHTDTFKGFGSNICICTLSSIDLLVTISKLEVMDKLVIAGRLLSENKGIDQMIEYCIQNPQIKYIILCGKDVKGHYPGDALINLIKNGIDDDGKVIDTIAPNPFLMADKENIVKFKEQISIIDLRKCFDVSKISETVNSLSH